uniref:protein xylosyltransferase n=1 Tax=Angiostrongylus cantonensis TaxID=6313 RepID=A0A0K0CTI2_ANGCA
MKAACKLKNGVFHEEFPESRCRNHDNSLVNRPVGCFEDQKNNRILDGFSYVFKEDNSVEKCRSFCYRAGFIFYGLEFGRECFCGDSIVGESIHSSRCKEYLCKKHVMPKAVYRYDVDSEGNSEAPRILFLLQLNGRNERQVKRLLKALYSPYHYYYIHVDQRQPFLLSEMKAVAEMLPNVYLAPNRHSTIWGGASLLTMVQDAIQRSIVMPSFSEWDYLINLSESDFPVLTLHELEVQLKLNPHKSYLSSHGYNTARFIQKQGFDFVFVECENHMWRVAKRNEFPRNLRVDGGSDWVVLHRNFAEYSISDDELAVKLRTLFSSVILPVESFFHTVSTFFSNLLIEFQALVVAKSRVPFQVLSP